MSSPVYSTRFALGNLTAAAGLTTLYTVPAGKRAVVKCLTAYPGVAGTSSVVWVFAGLALLHVDVGPPATDLKTELTIVLNSGETLAAVVTVGQVALSASGFLLDA